MESSATCQSIMHSESRLKFYRNSILVDSRGANILCYIYFTYKFNSFILSKKKNSRNSLKPNEQGDWSVDL